MDKLKKVILINNKNLHNILKYSFILQYLIKKDSFFINEYKIKLFKELIKVNNNYSYLLNLNNKELNKELTKIINTFFKQIVY